MLGIYTKLCYTNVDHDVIHMMDLPSW